MNQPGPKGEKKRCGKRFGFGSKKSKGGISADMLWAVAKSEKLQAKAKATNLLDGPKGKRKWGVARVWLRSKSKTRQCGCDVLGSVAKKQKVRAKTKRQ